MPITIERIQAVGERVPLIANLQPHGPYAMASLHAIGGVPIVMKELLRHGLLHGDVMTVTGKTLAENLADVPSLEPNSEIRTSCRPVERPIAQPNNHISVLKGNLAPGELPAEAVAARPSSSGEFRGRRGCSNPKPTPWRPSGPARSSPATSSSCATSARSGGPGMPEMVMLTIQLQGRGLGEDVALITDGRFSGVSHGILIGHISPEAARGGPLAAVRDGDTIVIDPRRAP